MLLRPTTKNKPTTRSTKQRGYYPDKLLADWDTLSNIAHSTTKLTLTVELAIRYKDIKPASKLFKTICDAYEKNTRTCCLLLEDNFWSARHDPNLLIAKCIARVRVAATDLTSVKLTPGDQQICDRLIRGLDDSWKTIHNHLVYSPNEVLLDDTIGALEAHEIATTTSLNHKGHHFSTCPNPSIKKKLTSFEARAGATSAANLNKYSEYKEEEDSFDETDVKWG
ncbi:hypothetical protein PSTG_14243 [Puccinia striiformis f. sp. tritici PST-78]|uniref:Uncharacterized protein n=1 Tax=Puccinia striiformis f. sp. tritici PST-78 TaxID=1165861 RepID=A0A0L0UZ68_9BASI|nr:hypothetical protein PSTG_14243 [Puccinia striiformis f. sp. tritici PST-78]